MHEYEIHDLDTDRYAYIKANNESEARRLAVAKFGNRNYGIKAV